MKCVVLTGGHPIQNALVCKLAKHVEVAAVVISGNVPKKAKPSSTRARILANRISGRIVGQPLVQAWKSACDRYAAMYPISGERPRISVRNVNDPATLEVIERHQPDLVIVSGTNLVGRAVIEAANRRLGIVNLHTGLSPYVKGGPNCTNWCLAEGWFHLIGNTVMWLDSGIDTGHIIATERTPLSGDETLSELHWKVLEHAHDLYVHSVKAIAAGKTVPRVPQDTIVPGHTFYTVEWNAAAMVRAQVRFRFQYRAAVRGADGPQDIVCVPRQ